MIKIKSKIVKNVFKQVFNERTNLHAGNLSYLTILALIPTLTIVVSIFNILQKYLPLLKHPYLIKISLFLSSISISPIASIIVNLSCVNLLSNGFFSLLTTLEQLYKINFESYLNKKIYSILLSITMIFTIVISLSLSITIQKYISFKNINYIIDNIIIFLSLLFFYKLSTFQKLKNIYAGSLISSVFLTFFLHIFYTIITNYSALIYYYGALTPIIISFLLIYYSCYMIYLGIIINYETYKFSRIKIIKR